MCSHETHTGDCSRIGVPSVNTVVAVLRSQYEWDVVETFVEKDLRQKKKEEQKSP